MAVPLKFGRIVTAVAVWASAIFGSLQLQHWHWSDEHGVCGPWGCGPPTESLLACQVGWLAVLAGPMWLATQLATSRQLRLAGIVVLTLGIGGLAGVAVHEALVWWPQAGAWSRPYWFQRYLFSLAILVDVPILQSILYGCGMILFAHHISQHTSAMEIRPLESASHDTLVMPATSVSSNRWR